MRNDYMNLINNYETANIIEILDIGEEICKPKHSEGPIVRENYLFHYIIKGRGKVCINGAEYKLSSGNGFLITYKDYIYYEADDKDPWHYVWIIVSGNDCENFFGLCGLNDEQPIYFSNNVEKTNEAVKIFLKKTAESENSFFLYGALYEYWGILSKCSIYKNCPQINETKRHVINAKKFVALNVHKKISVEDITKAVGIERSYLFRLFKEYEKLSPQEYMINYKMDYAKKLLKRGDLNVKQVASSVGYDDQCAFSKIFRKHFGRTPKEFIKLIKY